MGILILHLCAFATAWAGAVAALLWYFRYRKPLLCTFSIFMFSFSVICFGFSLHELSRLCERESIDVTVIRLGSALQGAILLPLALQFIGHKAGAKLSALIATIGVLFIMLAVLPVFGFDSVIFRTLFMILFFFTIILGMVLISIGIKDVVPSFKRYLKTVGITTLIFFPGFIADAFFHLPFGIPDNTIPSLFILFTSIESVFFAFQYLDQPAYLNKNSPTPHFRTTFQITERECELISILLAGYANKEIAEKLFISIKTVETHLTSIYNKCGVKSRTQLLALLRSNESQHH